jgi:hypothetical protein
MRMADRKQNEDFGAAVTPTYLLDDAIKWIKSNMEPEEVFSQTALQNWANENCVITHKTQYHTKEEPSNA